MDHTPILTVAAPRPWFAAQNSESFKNEYTKKNPILSRVSQKAEKDGCNGMASNETGSRHSAATVAGKG